MRGSAILLAVLVALSAAAQQPLLKPPGSSKVAVAVFEDLQCPDCARTSLIIKDQLRTSQVPLMRYDFPLPKHNWAFQAAVLARYFDGHNLGDRFRDYIYLYQPQVTSDNLRRRAEEFARNHQLVLPADVDPRRELAAKVRADVELGKQLGVEHTPTIYLLNQQSPQRPEEITNAMELASRIRVSLERSRR